MPKLDARQKATGNSVYTGDIRLPGTLHAQVLHSPVAHARLVGIDTTDAERLPGLFAVVTAVDALPVRIGRFIRDRTPLALDKVRHIGEPIAAVAARDQATAQEALALIKVTYEELPAVFDPFEAIKPGAPIIHEDLAGYTDTIPSRRFGNVRNEVRYAWGDLEDAFARSDLVLEQTYKTQPIHHAYLERRTALATFDHSGKLTIWCSTKAPFAFRSQVAQCLGMAVSQVRIIAPSVGGDYGGKGLATVEPICALLARKSGRPVRLERSRSEEFISGYVRHPGTIKLRTGMARDGTLLAVQGELIYDTGAYNDAITGLAHSCFNLAGPYKVQAAELVGRTVYTNNIPAGHVRAPGAPQTLFAIESQMNCMARELGRDPWEVRQRNAVEDGSLSGTGDHILRHVGLSESLWKARELSSRLLRKDGPNQGIGIACGQWEAVHFDVIAPSRATVAINEDGTATILSGITEQGGGQYTVMAQIAAEVLGLNLEDIGIIAADTDASPFESGTGASATTQRAGNSVRLAAEDARNQVLALAAQELEASITDLELADKKVYVRGAPDRAVSVQDVVRTSVALTGGHISGNSTEGQKRLIAEMSEAKGIIGSPCYGTQVAKVHVDPETGRVQLMSYLIVQDVGFALNPLNVEGQLEGSVAFGMGYTLSEHVLQEKGNVLVRNLSDYRVLTAVDVPDINVDIVEEPSSFGPYGAKGVGESGITPVAAALANAIEDAVGVRITELPITPERVLQALRKRGERMVPPKAL